MTDSMGLIYLTSLKDLKDPPMVSGDFAPVIIGGVCFEVLKMTPVT